MVTEYHEQEERKQQKNHGNRVDEEKISGHYHCKPEENLVLAEHHVQLEQQVGKRDYLYYEPQVAESLQQYKPDGKRKHCCNTPSKRNATAVKKTWFPTKREQNKAC
ncbi:hypothetical protein AUJ65_01750 [Candidatus Micrarchaeota archaeon CG1_02_51_15]|nr:MAG: hypothetical protein AUJ65_01750 [Candidatus Micrarchaeota archaeon CG1_02_51_15]